MFCGKIFDGEYQLRLESSGGGSIGGGFSIGWTGEILTRWTPSFSSVATGIRMVHEANQTGGGTTQQVRLVVPLLGIDETRSYSDSALVDQLVHVEGLKIYMDHTAVWRVKFDTLKWIVRGAVEHTSSALDHYSPMMPTPSSIPMFGIPPEMEPAAGVNPAVAIGCLSPGRPAAATRTSTSSVVGGYRIRYTGESDWVTPAVDLPANPHTGGAFNTGTVSGSDTWSISAQAYDTITDTGAIVTQDRGQCKVIIAPSLDRSVVLMDTSDYAALVFRWGFPKIEATTASSDAVTDCLFEPISDISSSSTDEVYGPLTQLFEEVNDGAAATITAPMSEPVYSPVQYVGQRTRLRTTQIETSSRSYIFAYNRLTVGDTANYLRHNVSWVPIWFNTWVNPHWSFGLWFPPDTASDSVRWKIDGDPVALDDYWYPARQQHMRNPGLPSGGSGRRNHVITEPVTNCGLRALWTDTLGVPVPWGVSRFYAQKPVMVECGADETSGPRYSCEEIDPLTVTAAGVVVASGTGPASLTLDFDLGSMSVEPYLAAHLADEIRTDWTGATSVEVYLVGVDGSELRINPLGDQGWHPRLQGDLGSKYGHTAENDFGQDYLPDTCIERKAAKSIAPLIASDAERSFAPGLLNGFTAEKLRWKVVRSTSVTTTIEHPRFRNLEWDQWRNLAETAQHSTVFGSDSPGVRLGTLAHWNYTTNSVQFPPSVHPQQNQQTVWDAIRSKRLIFQHKAVTDGLTAEIQSLYEEGVEWTQIKHLASDPFNQQAVTSAFWVNSEVGPINCLVSSYREPPPLAFLPRRERTSASGWDEGSVAPYKLKSYSHCPARRWHVAPGDDIELLYGSPLVDKLSGLTVSGGWAWAWHELVVDGTEGYDWRLSDGTEWYARLRPWRGYLLLPGSVGGGDVAFYAISQDTRHCVGFEKDDTLWLGFSDDPNPSAITPFDTGVPCEWVSGAWGLDQDRTLWLLVGGASTTLQGTTDEGGSFTIAQTLGSASQGAVTIAPDLSIWAYRLDAGTLKYTLISPDGSTIVESGDTNLSGLDDGPVGCASIGSGGNELTIGLTVSSGGSRVFYTSPDGKNFS